MVWLWVAMAGTSLVRQPSPSSSTLRYYNRRARRFQSHALLLRYWMEEGSLGHGRKSCLASAGANNDERLQMCSPCWRHCGDLDLVSLVKT
jgi:hypothetical protein